MDCERRLLPRAIWFHGDGGDCGGCGRLLSEERFMTTHTMNIRHALILAVTSVLFLIGCTTTHDEATRNEKHIQSLMRHHDWPQIQQIAQQEVKQREIAWPDSADYLPTEHKDKLWAVTAMTGTPNGDLQRVVMLMIGDDGKVLAYERYWNGQPVPAFPDSERNQ